MKDNCVKEGKLPTRFRFQSSSLWKSVLKSFQIKPLALIKSVLGPGYRGSEFF